MVDPAIFRMYDIRGVAGEQLTDEVASLVGRALGSRIRRSGSLSAAVGRDVRHSSPGLAHGVAEGLAACGLEVQDLGVVPTPTLYHCLHREALGGGVMVTGSHNPKADNGLKLCLGVDALHGEAITSLRDQALAGDFEDGAGRVTQVEYLPRYLDDICGRFQFPAGLNVAVDCGNGVMGPVVLEALERLGVGCEALYCEPDGDFPHHMPDPEVPANMEDLGRLVRGGHAVCGFGFDGDGDRVGVLDENGDKLSADLVLAVFARDMLRMHRGGKVRFDVKCSDALPQFIKDCGGVPVMGKTGHSLLKRDIKQLDAILGGELSGHIVFNRGFLPIDDSLYCALYFLGLVAHSGDMASQLFAGFPKLHSTAEIKVPCADDAKFKVVAALVEHFKQGYQVNDLDGARVSLGHGTWFLVRCSNTTPNLTVRLEAPSQDELLRARDVLVAALETHPAVEPQVLRGVLV